MKKLLFISLLFSITLYGTDQLSQAIKQTDIASVKKYLKEKVKIQERHVELAQQIMSLREDQLIHNSTIAQEIPNTKLNKIGTVIGICGCFLGFWDCIDKFEFNTLRHWHETYYPNLYKARLIALGFGALTIANAMVLYNKKIKYLEETYNNAIEIYELIIDAESQETVN